MIFLLISAIGCHQICVAPKLVDTKCPSKNVKHCVECILFWLSWKGRYIGRLGIVILRCKLSQEIDQWLEEFKILINEEATFWVFF